MSPTAHKEDAIIPSPLEDEKAYAAHVERDHLDEVELVMKGAVHDMSPEDRATALQLAHEADPGPNVWSLRYLRFSLMLLVVCMCSGDNGEYSMRPSLPCHIYGNREALKRPGFDGTVMGSVNSMVQYQHYFNLQAASTGTGIVFVSVLTSNRVSGLKGRVGYLHGRISLRFLPRLVPPR